MNTKVLVETLTEIPDMELLQELSTVLRANNSLLLANPATFFHMLSCLFSCSNKAIKMTAIELYRFCFTFLLRTELESSWAQTSIEAMRMLGEEDL